jgi:ElaB/YqjD/DUF883 family membrane-anchored ribosome-binding protein
MTDDVAAAKARIEETRGELQETVDQLTDRLDPRVRAKEAGESVKHSAAEGVASVQRNPVPVAGIAAGVVAVVVAIVVWRRRH